MSYAVVKFINETESDEEVVSEVPTSWLSQNKEMCKWPPDRFASFYITKNFSPEASWKEYPVEVECFCDSLAEAKEKTKGLNANLNVGRGCRKVIPKDYFSPGEEEERQKEKKRNAVLKKTIPVPKQGEENYPNIFMDLLNKGHSLEESNYVDGDQDDAVGIRNSIVQSNNELEAIDQLVHNTEVIIAKNLPEKSSKDAKKSNYEGFSTCLSGSSTGGISASSVASAIIVSDSDIASLNKKMDNVIHLLKNVTIDLMDIKQRLEIPEKDLHEVEEELLIKFPLKNLTELEDLENVIKSNLAQKKALVKILKNIGGNDCKDFVTRLCKYIFTNPLAETCSWTGRKNNYCLCNMELTKIMYGIVHQKTKATQKDFEQALSEWLRHAKQRREREEKRNRNALIDFDNNWN